MSAKANLLKYLELKKIKKASFYKSTGLSNGFLDKNDNISSDKIEIIISVYGDLNTTWLLTGEGEMLKNDSVSNINAEEVTCEGYETLLLPISAQGGTFDNFVTSVSANDCETIIAPIKGMDFAVTVTGESMSPEYPNGSKVLIKKVNERAFIDWGRVFVLDTCNGSVIKKILPGSDDKHIKCISTNTDYPSFEVAFEDIHGMFRVHMMLSLK